MLQNPGKQLSVHKGLFSSGGWLWYIGIILIISFIGNLYKGDLWLAIVSLVIGILLLIGPVLRWRQSMAIFENGFVLKRLTGTHAVRKDDIQQAQMSTHYSRLGQHIEVQISVRGGREFSVVGMSDSEQICNTLAAWGQRNAAADNDEDSQTVTTPAATVSGGWVPPKERNV